MLCDLCNKWVHVSCDSGINESEYDELILNPTSDMWFCSYCTHSEVTPQASPTHLNCIHMNMQSIVSKKLDLLALISTYSYDVTAFTETFLDHSIGDSEFSPPSYVAFRCDRDRHGGGVLILVRDSIPVFRCSDLESGCEIVWLQITTRCPRYLLFGVYYHPPELSLESLSYLNNSLLSIAAYRHSIVLCGDFNVPNIEWASVSPTLVTGPADHLCSTVLDNSLFQHVDCPTRDNNILDLVLSSSDCVSSVNVVDNLPSTDHSAVKFHLSVSIPVQHSTQRFLYNYKKTNFSTFHEVLFHVPWSCVTDCNDLTTHGLFGKTCSSPLLRNVCLKSIGKEGK